MCRLLETIKIKNGAVCHLVWHNRRANEARKMLFGASGKIDFGAHISPPKAFAADELLKCRIVYREEVERIEYLPYRLPVVSSLKLVFADGVDYRYKYEDRSALEELKRQRGSCDEILIVRRGLVTDTSFSNVVFFDGERYVTPDGPLLPGVKRAILLHKGVIAAERITVEDIGRFVRVFLINSMIDVEDGISIPTDAVVR